MKFIDGLGRATAINISLNTIISPPSRAMVAAAAGVVNVTMAEDGTVLLLPLAAGVPAYYEVSAVSNVNSTATGVVVFKQH